MCLLSLPLSACVRAKSFQSCPALCDPVDYSPPGSSVLGDSPGKNTVVGCHALLQGIFLTQGSNMHLLCLLCWQVGSLPLAPPGKASLYTGAKSVLGDRVLGEVEKDRFIALPGKGEHSRLIPSKLCVPALEQ